MARYSDAERQAMNEAAVANEQRIVTVGLGAEARRRGGNLTGTAPELYAFVPSQPGAPASAAELDAIVLPALASKPGLDGVTVTRFTRSPGGIGGWGRRSVWEVRADPVTEPVRAAALPVAVTAYAAPPLPIAAAAPVRSSQPSPQPVARQPVARQPAPPRAPAAAAAKVELIKEVPTEARRLAANDAAWAAIQQAVNEAVEDGAAAPPMSQRIEACRTIVVTWLNADPREANAKALAAARKALSMHHPNPPPRAA